MLITLSRRIVICQSVAEVYFTVVAPLGAISHRFNFIIIIIIIIIIIMWRYSRCRDLSSTNIHSKTLYSRRFASNISVPTLLLNPFYKLAFPPVFYLQYHHIRYNLNDIRVFIRHWAYRTHCNV